MCPKQSNSLRIYVYPLIPAIIPTIIVDKQLVISNINDLSLKPLFNSISRINPLPHKKRALSQIEHRQVRCTFNLRRCASRYIPPQSILRCHHPKRLQILIQRLQIVPFIDLHRVQNRPCILLENEHSVPPYEIRIIFLDQEFRKNLRMDLAISLTMST